MATPSCWQSAPHCAERTFRRENGGADAAAANSCHVDAELLAIVSSSFNHQLPAGDGRDGGGESMQIKLPGLGPSVAWHQDGTTHWSESDGSTPDICSHGFNYMLRECSRTLLSLATSHVSCR